MTDETSGNGPGNGSGDGAGEQSGKGPGQSDFPPSKPPVSASAAPQDDPDDEIEASRAPLLDHLTELRRRIIVSLIALAVAFGGCFFFARDIFNLLLKPYQWAARRAGAAADAALDPETAQPAIELIYTGPFEYFFTIIKLAAFGAVIVGFPILAAQVYLFIAPGLYRNERRAFLPFLVATPVLFAAGAALVYFLIMPLAMEFALKFGAPAGGEFAEIQLLPRVSEYLTLTMTLILAFGFAFQLPVFLTLLGRAGIVTSRGLGRARKYAVVGIFAFAAFVTPPDPISQIALGLAVLGLYELSVLSVRLTERRARAAAADAARNASA
ncbi:MAG: twin-arginine translocase subunit TatC [Parvularculaceae bacterium]